MRLAERVALITGAGSGIGEATARRFAREGARVAVNDAEASRAKRVAEGILADGGRAIAVEADVARAAEVDSAVRRVLEEWGRVDVLVNNAGITRDAMLAKMTEEQWDEVLAVNLKGAFLCARAVLPGMRERGWGRVVNTASVGALGNIGQANYAASKAGVIGLTRTLALEYARYGVTVNAVAPGATLTPMLAAVPDQVREKIVARIPAARLASPDEVAALHCFLASEEAGYITGQVIFIDGGLTVGI
ncbi:MAG: beta-ketoacyl-ACP reductase [Candidatus Rokubacteria bacterium]|nr:beta-ketoacyl-ACP reductase [Candidatus Rokubacteria bacterium]